MHVSHPSETAALIPPQTDWALLHNIVRLLSAVWPKMTDQAPWEVSRLRFLTMFHSVLSKIQANLFKELACFPAITVAIHLYVMECRYDLRATKASQWAHDVKHWVPGYPDEYLPYVFRGFDFIRDEIRIHEPSRKARHLIISKLMGIATVICPGGSV